MMQDSSWEKMDASVPVRIAGQLALVKAFYSIHSIIFVYSGSKAGNHLTSGDTHLTSM